jgi:hypothetical protein
MTAQTPAQSRIGRLSGWARAVSSRQRSSSKHRIQADREPLANAVELVGKSADFRGPGTFALGVTAIQEIEKGAFAIQGSENRRFSVVHGFRESTQGHVEPRDKAYRLYVDRQVDRVVPFAMDEGRCQEDMYRRIATLDEGLVIQEVKHSKAAIGSQGGSATQALWGPGIE